MKKLLMGIDSGSQSTKVGLFDQQGNEVCYGSDLLKNTETPAPGVVFHPGEDLWESLQRAIANCLEKFTGDREQIQGIGLCTIRCCRVLLDKEGELAEPVISWMDMRMSQPYVHQNEAVKYVTTTSGYLGFRLTGAFKDSCSNQEVYWPMDWQTLQWADDAEIETLGLKRSQLFELIKPGESFGPLRAELVEHFGLRSDIQVFATGNDKAVEVLGAGINSADEIMISLGTFISAMLYRHDYYSNAESFFPTLACEPFKYVYESTGIRRGMWTVSWFKNLAGEDISKIAEMENIREEDVLNRIAESIAPGSEGLLTLLDWLSPPSHQFRKGVMLGFDQRHTKYHIYRSILEAIAYTIKNHIDAMLEETSSKINTVYIIGGGAKSDVLVQIICDLFGKETYTLKASSSACLGAAMCAAIGLGLAQDFNQAKSGMVHTKKKYVPNQENHIFYDAMNSNIYKKIRNHTDPLLSEVYDFLNRTSI
ncbi:autoinducer-2 (AI-2) kinase [Yersinia aldovae]|uniref:FGGY-family carbohydrate kinase n=1 Tax=Yersinia aldovae TaxID=29483 RepID=UPI0005E0DA97|nr:FGGY family carbohydrate kinase [Yersinia aldovae]CNH95845.1 autoinducer-2 (AI-2) kinase [Yersinia aldovae]